MSDGGGDGDGEEGPGTGDAGEDADRPEGPDRPRLAVDADVLLGALARDGAVRRLVVLGGLDLVCPQGTLDELGRHAPLLAARCRLDRAEMEEALEVLARYVDEVPFEDYEGAYTGLEMAYPWAGVRETDLLALAKAGKVPIWTANDAFDQADDLEVLSTEDVTREVAR